MYVLSQFGLYLLLSLPLIGAYLMFAVGVVVIFRASRVLNLAHGAMAMLPAYVTYSFVKHGVPTFVALLLGVISGALLGMLVERTFVRPLARQGPTAQTVGTVAVFGLVVAAVAQIYGSGSVQAPHIFPDGGITVSTAVLRWGQIGLFGVAVTSLGASLLLLRKTRLGLSMRGAAENPLAASLMGVNPLRMARLAWSLGGALAGLGGILLAAVTSLDPYSLSLQMLPGFVAALIGGLGSLPGALVGAFIVGSIEGLVPAFGLVPGLRGFAGQVGVPEVVLTVLGLIVLFLRGQRYSAAETTGGLSQNQAATITHSAYDPRHLPRRGGRRRLNRYVLLGLLVAWPYLPLGFLPVDKFSLLGDANQAGAYFLVAASLVLLTGWVGQISLAQGAFVGIGAFGTALLAHHMPMPFPVGMIAGGVLGGGVAAALGVVALRVRGLYLAVATLIFAWMADAYLFITPWFASGGSATLNVRKVGITGTFPFFDFTDRKTFYFVVLAICSTVMFGLLNLRDSKTGRAFAAVRGSETAAAALGVNVVRTKLFAFVAAGAIAGIAGNLELTNQTTVVSDQFNLQASLLILAIAVVGGLRSLGGAVAASCVFAGLDELFFRVPALGRLLQLVSAVLLAAVLLAYPGGLAALPNTFRNLARRLRESGFGQRVIVPAEARYADAKAAVRARLVALVAGEDSPLRRAAEAVRRAVPRRPVAGGREFTSIVVPHQDRHEDAPVPAETTAATEPAEPAAPAAKTRTRRPELDDAPVALQADNITVRFGGLTAVSEASIEVPRGHIVGLIGPNGAGKTTLFNAVSALNQPTTGTVRLFGEDVTALAAHERAARGLARTFQVIQLFPELTVFDNLMVATHVHNPTGPAAHIVATAKAIRAESAAEETCRRVVDLLGLQEIADRSAAGLPFGTLRRVEFARALVSGAPLVMLDEPASGLDDTETKLFADVLLQARDELDLSVLLIEHDVHMVTSTSDYIYVLDRGQIIASGRPEEITKNPAVIAAYLGEAAAEADTERKPARKPRKRAAAKPEEPVLL
ncbi:MAG: branched-chain amino acid transport system ATP-binding protein [Frankiaceae bacterium]|jgi:sulfate-transporting ATPase|nr:branched-chain amino acid transport system ATP-binding protein [Frankiaceae bacterium]